jgi:cytochrome c oxidase subunit 2
MRRHQLAQMLIIGVIASIIGIVLALLIDWFPVDASTQAKDIDRLYDVLLIVSVPIFVLVMVVVLYSVWKFRAKPGQEAKDGAPIHGNTTLEVIWTALPALLLFGLMAYTLVVLSDIEAKEPDTRRVNVTAQQFTWTFEYPDVQGPDGKPLRTTELVLEKDVPVEFKMNTLDVIHSFWIPEMRMKRDVVPGLTTSIRVTPNRTGDYAVVCAELCGAGHAVMRQATKVLDTDDYQRWTASATRTAEEAQQSEQGAEGEQGAADPAAAGKQVFTANGCGACHTLADADAKGTTGPNLDEVLANLNEAQIREAIVDPNATVAEGFSAGVMPDNYAEQLDPEQLNELVAYLASQK